MNKKHKFVIFTVDMSDSDIAEVVMELTRADVSFEYIASKQQIRYSAYATFPIGPETYSRSYVVYR